MDYKLLSIRSCGGVRDASEKSAESIWRVKKCMILMLLIIEKIRRVTRNLSTHNFSNVKKAQKVC